MRILVESLRQPGHEYQGNWVWPTAYADAPTDADWSALSGLYPADQVTAGASRGSSSATASGSHRPATGSSSSPATRARAADRVDGDVDFDPARELVERDSDELVPRRRQGPRLAVFRYGAAGSRSGLRFRRPSSGLRNGGPSSPGGRRRGASGTRRTPRRSPPARRARGPRRSRRIAELRDLLVDRPLDLRTRDAHPWRSHCQTCEREISLVAASSIRLKIATAPEPFSQAARYWIPTETLLRSPSSVISPGVAATSSRAAARRGRRRRAAVRAGSGGRRARRRTSPARPGRGRDARPTCRRSPGRPRAACPRAPSRARPRSPRVAP